MYKVLKVLQSFAASSVWYEYYFDSDNEEELTSIFLPACILLSLGGSGMHITGFHFTNIFVGDGKKKAYMGISAAFGASSAIFPIMQVLN